jgi:hypothetical protein
VQAINCIAAYLYKRSIMKELKKCPFCEVERTEKSLRSHIWLSHTEAGAAHKLKLQNQDRSGRVAWNKGLTKGTDERIDKQAKNQKNKIANGTIKTNKGKKIVHSKEWLQQLSERQSLNNSGGKSKWYNVDNQKLQGTWERDLAIKMNELGIQWQKLKTNRDIIKYIGEDSKIHSYTPDFELPEFDKLLEVKGYWWGSDKLKMQKVLEQNTELENRLVVVEKVKYKKLLEATTISEFIDIIGSFV